MDYQHQAADKFNIIPRDQTTVNEGRFLQTVSTGQHLRQHYDQPVAPMTNDHSLPPLAETLGLSINGIWKFLSDIRNA